MVVCLGRLRRDIDWGFDRGLGPWNNSVRFGSDRNYQVLYIFAGLVPAWSFCNPNLANHGDFEVTDRAGEDSVGSLVGGLPFGVAGRANDGNGHGNFLGVGPGYASPW